MLLPASKSRLVAGHESITTYRFNSGTARHTFCKVCGIKPFYIPRSNPDGVDVNVRTLQEQPRSLLVVPFDGQHWEQHAHALAHKSRAD